MHIKFIREKFCFQVLKNLKILKERIVEGSTQIPIDIIHQFILTDAEPVINFAKPHYLDSVPDSLGAQSLNLEYNANYDALFEKIRQNLFAGYNAEEDISGNQRVQLLKEVHTAVERALERVN